MIKLKKFGLGKTQKIGVKIKLIYFFTKVMIYWVKINDETRINLHKIYGDIFTKRVTFGQ